jgi:hypothetical protein
MREVREVEVAEVCQEEAEKAIAKTQFTNLAQEVF